MTAIQGWNWENVDESQHKGDECRKIPELKPIPLGREKIADGAETAHAFSSISSEDVLKVIDVAR